jgi:hypothetical protein
MDEDVKAIGTPLRTPRAAAVAGILFALLIGLALTLIRLSIPYDPAEAGARLMITAGGPPSRSR